MKSDEIAFGSSCKECLLGLSAEGATKYVAPSASGMVVALIHRRLWSRIAEGTSCFVAPSAHPSACWLLNSCWRYYVDCSTFSTSVCMYGLDGLTYDVRTTGAAGVWQAYDEVVPWITGIVGRVRLHMKRILVILLIIGKICAGTRIIVQNCKSGG